MNIDELRQQLASMATEVSDTDTTTRIAGVEGKVKQAQRKAMMAAGVVVAAVVAVVGLSAPQLLSASRSVGPADQTPTQQAQPSPTPGQTPTTSGQTPTTPEQSDPSSPSPGRTPVGEQTFVDQQDSAAPYVDITRVDVTNSSNAVKVVVHAADLEPGAAVLDLMLTTQLKGYIWTAKPLYAVDASGQTDETFRASLITDPESGLGRVKCPQLTAETSSDASSEMRVTVPRSCLGELEPGPFRLSVRLYTPVEGGGLDDYLNPRPIIVK